MYNEEEEDDQEKCASCDGELPFEPLELNVWASQNKGTRPQELHFCSWGCVFDHLPSVNSDYFAALPYLHFDRPGNDGANEFLRLISPKKSNK